MNWAARFRDTFALCTVMLTPSMPPQAHPRGRRCRTSSISVRSSDSSTMPRANATRMKQRLVAMDQPLLIAVLVRRVGATRPPFGGFPIACRRVRTRTAHVGKPFPALLRLLTGGAWSVAARSLRCRGRGSDGRGDRSRTVHASCGVPVRWAEITLCNSRDTRSSISAAC